jgi:type I restriction enzyme S subunit
MSEVPAGWTTAPLSELVSFRKGKKPDSIRSDEASGFVPYLDIHAIEKGVTRQYAEAESARIGTKEDVFVVWDGARSGWVGLGREGAIGSTIMALRPLAGEQRWLYHFLQTQFDTINGNTRGTGIPHVDPEVFWNLEVPLAPLPEQRRIVAKLETLLAKVDACRQRLEKIPVLLKRFRQSVLAAACSGKITADWREDHPATASGSNLLEQIRQQRLATAESTKEKNQIAEAFQADQPSLDADDLNLEQIPDSWCTCRIGAIGIVVNGSTPSRKHPEFWDGRIPWVSSGEVRNNIITTTREKITKAGFENSSVRLLPEGTVLLAMIGEGKTRGQTAVLRIAATINQNIAAVVLTHGLVVSEFLWRWFQLQYEATRERGGGSGPQALNCQRVRELPFVLPPLTEQQEIVRRVEALFALADQIAARAATAQAQVDKLTPSVLAKAFRGELVPQDPTDEPTSVLLERIPRQTKKNRAARSQA